ncbi:MAG: hypothetical protein J5797_06125 [Prevotella sp.]|nr:hypothetical protein [Prevotella sp.]
MTEMGKDHKSEIHITNNFNAPIGQHIDHVDTINFRMDHDGNFHFGMVEQVNGEPDRMPHAGTEKAADENTDVVERLKPIFYNDEENVRTFLKEIAGMKAKDITELVNSWVKAKRISDYGNSRKGDLWEILTDAKLYDRTLQNWCRRVY